MVMHACRPTTRLPEASFPPTPASQQLSDMTKAAGHFTCSVLLPL